LEKDAQPVKSSETTSPAVAEEVAEGVIRGKIKYPWGAVKSAKIVVGEETTLSDNIGNYEFTSLRHGVYQVVAQAPFPGYEAASLTVEVKADETKVVDIYLDFKKTTAEGHVYDQGGKPISGATLSGVLSGRDMESVTTDEEGHFRFDRVSPGNRRFVRVNAPGFVGETQDFTAFETEPTVLEFHLKPATFRIYGKVTDSEGKPLKGEVLLLKMGIVIQKTVSDGQTGYYEFPVDPGRYELLTSPQGYLTKGCVSDISTADAKADLSLDPAVA
jgi:protocatechuate 3,4-dioxygenase beta subunit